jgi:hypothetical protein
LGPAKDDNKREDNLFFLFSLTNERLKQILHSSYKTSLCKYLSVFMPHSTICRGVASLAGTPRRDVFKAKNNGVTSKGHARQHSKANRHFVHAVENDSLQVIGMDEELLRGLG